MDTLLVDAVSNTLHGLHSAAELSVVLKQHGVWFAATAKPEDMFGGLHSLRCWIFDHNEIARRASRSCNIDTPSAVRRALEFTGEPTALGQAH